MAGFKKWIKRAVEQVVDPDRDQRIDQLANQLERAIARERKQFSITSFAETIGATDRDLEQAKGVVYRRIIDRAWKDGKVSQGERRSLEWIIDCLRMPKTNATALQRLLAREHFSAALSQALDDGQLTSNEVKRLDEIANSVQMSLRDFVRTYFREEGERFLRGMFTACTESGVLADDAWQRLSNTASQLGFDRDELTNAIRSQAQRFVEHVLADAKSDGYLSEREERLLIRLVHILGLPAGFGRYVQHHIAALQTIRLASCGKLPVLSMPRGISLRSGEIVHYHDRAEWLQKRVLRSGIRWDRHSGTITITDNRLLFSSDTKSFNVGFSKIVAHSGDIGTIRLQRMQKPECLIEVDEDEAVAYAILESALALANQTRMVIGRSKPTRHIPRDVRQRVWQRYGGLCAECGADQYLEFDHIVPVARGGGNSDLNVQLLCRKCNLKKSDNI